MNQAVPVGATRWVARAGHRPAPTKFLGFLPLCFFLGHLIHHTGQGTPQHIYWLCNISNLVMALGLFFNAPFMVRIAVMWLIPGVPLWIWDMMKTGDNPLSTFFSHIGGLTVGIVALSYVRVHRRMWLHAWIYGFCIQMFCRLFTPRELNVNIAFGMYSGWETLFSVYWKYWLFTAAQAAVGMWLLGVILFRIFPPNYYAEAK